MQGDLSNSTPSLFDVDVPAKRCRRCHITKPLDEFHLCSLTPIKVGKGHRNPYRESRCRKCKSAMHKEWMLKHPDRQRNSQLLQRYGITLEQYEAMFTAQGGCCAICGIHADQLRIDKRTGKILRLAVDHCHDTGKVRGLLCVPCNKGLGCFGDDPSVVHAALAYLEKHGKTR